MKIFNKNIVEKNDFLSALILYYLSERKHDFNELNEKLNLLNTEIDLEDLLARLSDKNLIEKTDDFYKIKLDFLLGGG
jgi:DNA-binding HxlR family transcriptional regulator